MQQAIGAEPVSGTVDSSAANRLSGTQGPGRRALFAFKAFLATVSGGMLTAVVAVGQTWYMTNVDLLRRQSERGLAYQQRLVDVTGRMEAAATRIVNGIRSGNPQIAAATAADIRGPFDRQYDEWRTARLLLRNEGAELYGRGVAHLIYDLKERAFDVDACNVVTQTGRGGEGTDCARRQASEIATLTRLQADVTQSDGFEPLIAQDVTPRSFNANLSLFRTLAFRWAGCVRTAQAGETAGPRCRNMEHLQKAIVRRYDFLVMARINATDEIMERVSPRG